MPRPTYNLIAGPSVERLAALSDGIFGVAMTLLVLELHVPLAEAVHSERDLLRVLAALVPSLVVYGLSFLTLGIFWVGQQTQLNNVERSARSLTWIHLGFLFAVTFDAFTTRLVGESHELRTALIVYWLNILLLGAALYVSWICALRTGLVKPELDAGIPKAIQNRILNRANALRVGRCTLPIQHTLEHRLHRCRPTELCFRAAPTEVPRFESRIESGMTMPSVLDSPFATAENLGRRLEKSSPEPSGFLPLHLAPIVSGR